MMLNPPNDVFGFGTPVLLVPIIYWQSKMKSLNIDSCIKISGFSNGCITD